MIGTPHETSITYDPATSGKLTALLDESSASNTQFDQWISPLWNQPSATGDFKEQLEPSPEGEYLSKIAAKYLQEWMRENE